MKIFATNVTSTMLIREEEYIERHSHRYVAYCTQMHIGEQFKEITIVFYTKTRCDKLPCFSMFTCQ
jgi:hypothetical protein